ncbi:MAG: hypothetical protein ACT6WE_28850, partial [Shinella sp.]
MATANQLQDEKKTYQIQFDEGSAAERTLLAQSLQDYIAEVDADIDIQTTRENEEAQDFGSTLVLVLGTPVAIIVAKAIADFLHRNSGAMITISENGKVVARGLD